MTPLNACSGGARAQVQHAGLSREGREAIVSSHIKEDQGGAMGVLGNYNHLQMFSRLQVADL